MGRKAKTQKTVKKKLEESGRQEADLKDLDARIRKSLSINNHDIDECISCLDSLYDCPVTTVLLRKNSTLVQTVKKCSKYDGSGEIRKRADKVLQKFRHLISSSPKMEHDGNITTRNSAHSISENYNLRRSQRNTNKNGTKSDLIWNRDDFEIRLNVDGSGRGVYTRRCFEPGDFLLTYDGKMLSKCPSTDDTYIFEVMFKSKTFWIDASTEDDSYGRLINDDHKRPNCRPKAIEIEGKPTVGFYASRALKEGEEIRYCYGKTAANYPWRSKKIAMRAPESTTYPAIGAEPLCCALHPGILENQQTSGVFDALDPTIRASRHPNYNSSVCTAESDHITFSATKSQSQPTISICSDSSVTSANSEIPDISSLSPLKPIYSETIENTQIDNSSAASKVNEQTLTAPTCSKPSDISSPSPLESICSEAIEMTRVDNTSTASKANDELTLTAPTCSKPSDISSQSPLKPICSDAIEKTWVDNTSNASKANERTLTASTFSKPSDIPSPSPLKPICSEAIEKTRVDITSTASKAIELTLTAPTCSKPSDISSQSPLKPICSEVIEKTWVDNISNASKANERTLTASTCSKPSDISNPSPLKPICSEAIEKTRVDITSTASKAIELTLTAPTCSKPSDISSQSPLKLICSEAIGKTRIDNTSTASKANEQTLTASTCSKPSYISSPSPLKPICSEAIEKTRVDITSTASKAIELTLTDPTCSKPSYFSSQSPLKPICTKAIEKTRIDNSSTAIKANERTLTAPTCSKPSDNSSQSPLKPICSEAIENTRVNNTSTASKANERTPTDPTCSKPSYFSSQSPLKPICTKAIEKSRIDNSSTAIKANERTLTAPTCSKPSVSPSSSQLNQFCAGAIENNLNDNSLTAGKVNKRTPTSSNCLNTSNSFSSLHRKPICSGDMEKTLNDNSSYPDKAKEQVLTASNYSNSSDFTGPTQLNPSCSDVEESTQNEGSSNVILNVCNGADSCISLEPLFSDASSPTSNISYIEDSESEYRPSEDTDDDTASAIFPTDKESSNVSSVQPQSIDRKKIHSNSGTSSKEIEVITKMNTSEGRVYDKKFICPYCQTKQAKLPRHLESKHKEEVDVAKFLIEKNPHEKKKMMIKLRNLGTSIHNAETIRKGSGQLIVAYRPSNYVPWDQYVNCEYCFGYYVEKDLWKHETRCELGQKKKKNGRVLQTARLLMPTPEGISDGFHVLMASMRGDSIGLCCKGDKLISELGEKMYLRHGHDKEQYAFIRNTLRELGRLLLHLRKTVGPSGAGLINYINSRSFSQVVQSARAVAGFNERTHEYDTPSLATKLGGSLKKCANIVKRDAYYDQTPDLKEDASEFIELIDMEWTDEVNFHAHRTLNEKRRNKVKLIPLTKDTMLLSQYLQSVGDVAWEELQTTDDVQSWMDLAEATLAQIILFNRRRQGEASKMTVGDFNKKRSTSQEDIMETLSPLERKLCQRLERVEIIGKRGRVVPLILTGQTRRWIDMLLSKREAVGVDCGNKFIFARPNYGSKGHIREIDLSGQDSDRHSSEDNETEHPAHLEPKMLRQKSKKRHVPREDAESSDEEADYLPPKKRRYTKFSKRPWSEREKTSVVNHFERNIMLKKLPGKRDIEKCMAAEPSLKDRKWTNIKDFIRNMMKPRK